MEIKTTEIKLIPIEQLKHYGKNRNIHPEDQIARLADLIKTHGFRDPLTVDQDTMEVITGNGTLMACKLLNVTHVPCNLQTFESEEKRYAFSISHNAISDWATIDLSQIHIDLEQMEPFELSDLGFRDFKFEPSEKLGAQELDQNDFNMFKHICPKCGFEFDEDKK